MKQILILAMLLNSFFLGPAIAQQQPPPASAEEQLQMVLAKARWLEQSRSACENTLADLWSQASKLEKHVQALTADKTQLQDELKALKEKPDAAKKK